MIFSITAQSAATPASSSGRFSLGKGLIACWLLLWSLITISLDVTVVVKATETALTWGYPVANGTISKSELRHDAAQAGDRGAVEITYQFRIGDREFTGSRAHFFDIARLGTREAKRLIKSLPVGQAVEVYYNPTEPVDCALDRSLGGRPLFLGLLLMPLNLVMVAGWYFARRAWRGLHNSMIQPDGDRWIVRRQYGSPFAVALIIAGAINIVLIILLSSLDVSDNLAVMSVVWTALVGVPTLAYRKTSAEIRSDLPILIADDNSRMLIWPSTAADGPEKTIRATQVRRVEVLEMPSPTSSQAEASCYSLSVTYVTDEGHEMKQLVFETENGIDADSLAYFLNDWTGIGHHQEELQSEPESNPGGK